MLDDEENESHRGRQRNFMQDFIKNNKDEIESNKNADSDQENTIEARANVTDKSHNKRSKTKRKLDDVHRKDNERKKRSQNERHKRDTILDRGINHGGNAAQNHKANRNTTADSSTSSFENALLECYDGEILVAKYFPPSNKCANVKYLEQAHSPHLLLKHEVNTDGYYYYIFYSDNDDEENHIHAIFDIHKPTYLYSNISETKGCINSTACHFPIQMFSDEVVIVEVPTRDGIEHEDDDITLLISQCVPRMTVYMIFPILVLIFILGCAFI